MLITMVPILINKDVFEPGYNDLRFTIGNHNYFFTNLITIEKHKITGVRNNYTEDKES